MNVLAFRIPRRLVKQVLGTVTAYPLPKEFLEAWDQLPPPPSKHHKQPYRALAIALTAATGQPVRLFGERDLAESERQRGDRMLLVTDALLDHRFRLAVRAWERRVRGGHAADIELADLLPEPEKARSLARYVQFRKNGVPLAAGWVFEIATWQVVRKLAAVPLRVSDDRSQRLRMDTNGDLLAWDTNDVLRGQSQMLFGMCRVSAKLTTRAGVDDLVLTFDAHVSRFQTKWAYAKHAWQDRDGSKPLVRIPLWHKRHDDNSWITHLHSGIEAVLKANEISAIRVGQDLPLEPGGIRPSARSFYDHAVGSGQGPRYLARLHEHVRKCLPELEELQLRQDKRIVVPVRKTKADDLPDIDICSTGHQSILILCLYATTHAHSRMLAELRALANADVSPVPGGAPVPVVPGVEVAVRHCPEFLKHGVHNQAAFRDEVLDLEPMDGRLVVAWVETEYHPEEPIEAKDDAKPRLRRLFAKRGIPSQFLATDPPGRKAPRTERDEERKAKEQGHAARSALRELFRLAGATGRHLSVPPGGGEAVNPLGRDALLVGIHARRQQTGGGDEKPLVLTMVAIDVRSNASSWRTLMAGTTTHTWFPAAQGIAEFHSGDIGTSSLGRTEAKAARTRDHVEKMLRELVTGNRTGLPVVVFVDAAATRSIWPGLQDQSLGEGPLPGDLLASAGHDVAIVRLNDDLHEIGRPVNRAGGRRPADAEAPGSPGRTPKLYQVADSNRPLWMFPRMSRTIDSLGGRAGTLATRWTLSAENARQMGLPWHSYTATEILVVRAGGFDPVALAAMTARLCEHPVSWAGRTVFPVPLHLAVGADRDHPDHRAPADTDR
ncbi:RNaseH domain-containing protein [Saccharomonospora sp. NPDC046836]|uniref:RNaseH domain-containing protein n=1 Tax=Saccharomonospora sp. NPDC046836 TaxID=3156921 RepID=UPI0033D3A8F5